jgi:hypothetical protein
MDELLKHIPVNPLPNRAFRNKGNFQFEMPCGWGFTQPSFSNSVAYADFDNDGDLDLVINNENGPAFLYRNNASQRGSHFISFQLTGKEGNVFAVGSKVMVYRKGQVLCRELSRQGGFSHLWITAR